MVVFLLGCLGIRGIQEDARTNGKTIVGERSFNMAETVRVALWVRLEAKPGKEAEVEKFLRGGLSLVQQEPATTAWFGVRLSATSFGIFDAFPDEAGRQAHLTGKVAAALMASAPDLLAQAPSIEKVEVLAAKMPGASVGKGA
jgi:quinol monooxygenase YgiN